MLRLVSTLIDYEVEASDGSIGIVRDILFDDITWKLRWLAADTGDWLTRRHVLFHPSSINLFDKGGKFFQVRLARNLINAAPSLKKDQPVTLDFERRMFAYYDIDQDWQSSIFGERQTQGGLERGPQFNPASPPTSLDGTGCDPHLCSFKTVHGYHNDAKDGPIGHLHDAVIDTTDWLIHYLFPGGNKLFCVASSFSVKCVENKKKNCENNGKHKFLTSKPYTSLQLLDCSNYPTQGICPTCKKLQGTTV